MAHLFSRSAKPTAAATPESDTRSLSNLLERGTKTSTDRASKVGSTKLDLSGIDHLEDEELVEEHHNDGSKDKATADNAAILSKVRHIMHDIKIDAFLLSTGDPHQSEYVSDHDKLIAFVSGFTGSNATVVITQKEALLWTDGRYFLQAEKELSSSWRLMRMLEPDVPEVFAWILGKAAVHVVGVDPMRVSAASAKQLQSRLGGSKVLSGTLRNPVVEAWGQSRPAPCVSQVQIHGQHVAGEGAESKVAAAQQMMRKAGATALVVSMLDEVAWLLNIRGADIAFNPVVVAYVVVTLSSAHLFVDDRKLDEPTKAHLAHVTLHPYEAIADFLKTEPGPVWADSQQLNWRLFSCLSSSSVIDKPSPLTLPKAVKNESELQGVRSAHIRDGAALTAFLCWLDAAVRRGDAVTEAAACDMLEKFRARLDLHVGPSFATIAGYGPNGAIIHYRPPDEGSAVIGPHALFLLDSGAQYLDGTTDVTRTLHFGAPTAHELRCFSLVLRGHIALAKLVFPEGMLGSRFDCIARMPLWAEGLDYNHGTGHGVGAYLNVHEGPQRIGFRSFPNEVGFYPGMTVSNEPGYYEEGHFGIRVESVCITVPHDLGADSVGKKSCCFETVTMVPLQRSLIDASLLSADELAWVNAYHHKVRETIGPVIAKHFPEAQNYLEEHTAPILHIH